MAKEGSTIGGLMDSLGTLTSIALQYGVRWKPSSANSRISGSSRAVSPKIPKSATPPPSLITCSAGWRCNLFRLPRNGLPQSRAAGTRHAGLLEEEKKRVIVRCLNCPCRRHRRAGNEEARQRQWPSHARRRPRDKISQRLRRALSAGRAHVSELRLRGRPQRRLLQCLNSA